MGRAEGIDISNERKQAELKQTTFVCDGRGINLDMKSVPTVDSL